MSLNSQWFQKYKPSKLNNRKKRPFSTKTEVFFDCSNLMAHFKGLIYAKVELEAQGHDRTFTICHAL